MQSADGVAIRRDLAFARLVGFLTALGASLVLMLMIAVLLAGSPFVDGGPTFNLLWAGLFVSSPLPTVIYAFGWLRDWSIRRCAGLSVSAAIGLGGLAIVNTGY